MDENLKYEFKGEGLERREKEHGKEMFDDYVLHYHISSYSDMQMLEELIYRELMQTRLKKKIEKLEAKYKKEDKEYSTPKHIIETMNENFEQVLSIKEKLGMLENKDGVDTFEQFKILEAKFKVWCEQNQGSRTFTCPHCSKSVILYVKPDTWEAQGHKHFRDRILCNDHLVKLYKDKKITAEDVALILGTSSKYTTWLIQKWYQNEI